MTKVMAFANQKGGVGKTTSCINIAASLGIMGKRVLLLDLDPQGNASIACGVDKYKVQLSLNDFLLERESFDKVCIKNTIAGIDLIPSNADLTESEISLVKRGIGPSLLKQLLASCNKTYDFIVLDCPPSLNTLAVNALVAADSVIIPVQCEYYALEGLTALLSTITQIRTSVHPKLYIEGILRTMYDPRNELSRSVSSDLQDIFGSKVFQEFIPRNTRLAEAPSYGMPGVLYDPISPGAVAYTAIAAEISRRAEKGDETDVFSVGQSIAMEKVLP